MVKTFYQRLQRILRITSLIFSNNALKWSFNFIFDQLSTKTVSILLIAFSYPNFYITCCKLIQLRCLQSFRTNLTYFYNLLIRYYGYFSIISGFVTVFGQSECCSLFVLVQLFDYCLSLVLIRSNSVIQLYVAFEGVELAKELFVLSVYTFSMISACFQRHFKSIP